jgi:serine/threonine protein kinase
LADRLGQQFGNYRLVTLLGQGGYAEAYLGQHVRLPLQEAVKVLHAHLTEQEAEHFQQEAETIATLVHPGIIRVLDFDVQDEVPFLVMDYAPYGSLRQRHPKGSVLRLPWIVSYVKQVAAALHYAHEQKFIHRDVKPENMLVGRRQEVLLSDFGIATIAHSTDSLNTKEALGTLPYMAPEQIEGHPRAASDQYALGVVVYEWLCGSLPLEGSLIEMMVQHLTMPPPPLHEKVATIPREIEQVVLRALAKDPKERYASVQDFATALELASQHDVVPCQLGDPTEEELANPVSQAVANWQRSRGNKDPVVVTSKILDAEYMMTVDQSGRRIMVPASGHIVRLTIEATDSRTAIIQNLCPIVHSRSEATGSSSRAGVLGMVTPRHFEVLLDERPPCLKGPHFPFKVGPGDPEVFDLKVMTSTGDVEWWLELSWTCVGQEGTLRVDLGGSPFRTMARPIRNPFG